MINIRFHGGLDPLGYYYNANRPADTVMIINVGASAGTVGYSSVDFGHLMVRIVLNKWLN